MPKRLIVTIVCFHITAVMLIICGIALLVACLFVDSFLGNFFFREMKTDPNMMSGMRLMYFLISGISLLSGLGIECIIRGLNRRRYWAWIIGIIASCLLIVVDPLIFVTKVLGGLALWGLVVSDTTAVFKPTPASTTDNQ
ncbi:MAG: hypothetical protein ACYC64_13120 [Armatimonadota bacterium]